MGKVNTIEVLITKELSSHEDPNYLVCHTENDEDFESENESYHQTLGEALKEARLIIREYEEREDS